MPLDTNPFANNNQQQQNYQTPAYLQQNQANGTVPGVMANMVKALMDGNNRFQQKQMQPGMTPPVSPDGMQGGLPFGGTTPQAWAQNTMQQQMQAQPQAPNPVTNALFSQIPGENMYGG